MNPEELQALMQQDPDKDGDNDQGGNDPDGDGQANLDHDVNQAVHLDADKQRDVIEKYFYRFRQASFGMDDYHKLWNLLDLFDRGKQWDKVNIPAWIPKPITNLIRYVRTTKRANLAQAIPQANLTPMTPLDKGLVDKLQRAYEHVWDEDKTALTVRRCVDRSLLHGTAIAYVHAEENIRGKWYGEDHPNNQLYRYDIKTKRIPIGNFYIDPAAYNLQEARYITVTENLSLQDVKNNPIFREYAGDQLAKLTAEDLERDLDAAGDIFDRPTTKLDQSMVRVNGDQMATVHIHWERYRNDQGAWQVDVSYFLWNTHFLLYRIEDFKPAIYPFSVLYDEEEDNSFWGTSIAMDMLENQKIINKTAQAASIIGTLHQNPQKIVLRESGINAAEMSRTGTLAGKVWTSNVPNAVETINPPDIPKGLFDIEDRMKSDIKDMAGINAAYNGDSVGSLTTSTGVDSLIDRASIRDRDKSIQIDQFVEDLSEIIIRFILVYWREPRPIMTRQANGAAQFDEWTPVDPAVIDNLEWRVRSDVYAKAPITAASRSQQADTLMQMQGQFQYDPPIITPEEWIELKDFPNKQDILARMQSDRVNKQNQDASDLQNQILQIIGQAEAMKGQGMTDDTVKQQVTPMVQQLVQQTFTQGQNQGTSDAMPNSNSAPQGTTSPTAMGNMTKGM